MHDAARIMQVRPAIAGVAAVAVAACLWIFPVRTIMGELNDSRAASLVDDPATERRDVVEVTEETLSHYRSAIEALENASSAAPWNAAYLKALSGISVKLGRWAEVMEMMNAPLPEGAWSSRQAYERARDRLEQAVALEPSNAEYHLALGQLSGIAGNADGMDRSFERAVSFAPRNSPLRYVIAQEYLLAGRHESAARHARILAEQDDSYRIADSARKRILAERDLPAYRLHLQRSYLYRSLEILWRTGRQDQAELRMLCDGDTGAREVVRLFLEEKGLEE